MGVKGQKQKNTKWETIVYPRLSEIQKWCEEGLTNDVICSKLFLYMISRLTKVFNMMTFVSVDFIP